MADGKVTIDTELDNSGIEKDLKDIKREAKKAGDEVKDYAEAFDDAAKKSRQSKRDIQDDLDDIKKSINSVGDSISAGFALDFAIDFGTEIIESTEELRGELSLLDTNARNAAVGIDTTREAFQMLNTVSGETDSSVEAVSNLLAAGIPENKMQQAVEGLANAVTMFPDTLKIESLADSLQETLATGQATGQYAELLDRLGIGAENFNQQLAAATTTAEKQNLVLQTLTSGGLQGVYQGWAKANPELVQGRDAALELQMAMSELATEIQPIVTDITEIATAIISWVAQNINIEHFFETIVAGVAALAAVKAVDIISQFATKFAELGGVAATRTIIFAAAIGAIVLAAMELAKVWDTMTGAEKVVSILGMVTAAAVTAAIAVGAFQSALTLGIAAAAIAAGVAVVFAAINSATKRAESMSSQLANPNTYMSKSATIPKLAKGAVIPPNREFAAILGDQKNGTNLEAPESLIRQIVREESGGAGGTLKISPAPGLTRYLKYELEKEGQRAGTPLVQGVRR